jgi:hypothetical protein
MSQHRPVDPSERVPAPKIHFEPAKLRPRHDGWTAERQIRFIQLLAATKCVDEAARRVGMSDTSAYELRDRPCGADFRKAWDIALESQLDRVEHSAVERCVSGVVRPIFYKGEKVGEYRHFDERLTMFLLRTRRPQRYGKWIDQVPPPEPEVEAERPDRSTLLNDALLNIAAHAPLEDGNPIEDWTDSDDDQEEQGGEGEA